MTCSKKISFEEDTNKRLRIIDSWLELISRYIGAGKKADEIVKVINKHGLRTPTEENMQVKACGDIKVNASREDSISVEVNPMLDRDEKAEDMENKFNYLKMQAGDMFEDLSGKAYPEELVKVTLHMKIVKENK